MLLNHFRFRSPIHFRAGNFRKVKVERSEPPEKRKEQFNGFLTKTAFEHHNFTAMERFGIPGQLLN